MPSSLVVFESSPYAKVNKCGFGRHLIKLPVTVSVYDNEWNNFQQWSEC